MFDPKLIRRLFTDTVAVAWKADASGAVPAIPDWSRLTGQAPEDVEGAGWLDAVHPQDLERVQQAWQTSVAHHSAYNIDYRIRCADGIYRWFNARGTPIQNEDGDVEQWVGICLAIPGSHRLSEPVPGALQFAKPSEFEAIRPAALRAARAMLNLSAESLAEMSGISKSTIRRLEDDHVEIATRQGSIRSIIDTLAREGLVFFGEDGVIMGVSLG